MTKVRFGGLDLLQSHAHGPTRMPRTAVIPVVRDKRTGYLNAAPYSGGVTSIRPLQILFGPKSREAIEAFRHADEFCIAVPRRDQVDHMWVAALEVPHGISEIEVVGWHTLESRGIETPGIEECPLNLECRKIFFGQLPAPWRAIIIGEVVGVSIDSRLLGMRRSEVVKQYPMHEAGSHPKTGLYGPSVLSGELIPSSEGAVLGVSEGDEQGGSKTYVVAAELYEPENDRVLMNAVFPRPSYIVVTADGAGRVSALPICGGSLQADEPAVQVPIKKYTRAYGDIRESGEFVLAIPDRGLIAAFERLESSGPDGLGAAGFSLLKPNMINVPGIAECPVNMDCKVVMFEDVPGTDYAFVVARRVGVVLDEELANRLNPAFEPLEARLSCINELYSRYIYAVMDRGAVRKWGFHDKEDLSVRPLPSWGSRYTGGWWGPGPSLNYWLIELCDEGLISKPEYYKITHQVALWNDGRGVVELAEYLSDEAKAELRERLTRLFGMMAWAHRDYDTWDRVHSYLAQFPEPPRDHHDGPVVHEKWWGRVV